MKSEEDRLQAACVKWFDLTFGKRNKLLFSIANGGKRHVRTALTMKATGLRAGVADLCFFWGGKALFVEMKTPKGTQQKTQKEWQSLVESQQGEYVICRTFDEFRAAILNHIETTQNND